MTKLRHLIRLVLGMVLLFAPMTAAVASMAYHAGTKQPGKNLHVSFYVTSVVTNTAD